ncbi:DNA-directed DNA polymerase [Tanacetum coccineum]|uniref:DNA-directed DNA polymerase n=1 Tax=Tanacetum coccineum TaxID=301880 RepID=A0ABQ4WIP1_9ASTR
MSLKLADRLIQYPRGIVKNVLIKVDKFFLPIDFVIMDMPEDSRILIILGRPFLATAHAMIDVFNKKITVRVGDDEELLENDQLDLFFLKGLEKLINHFDLESYNSIRDEFDNDSDVDLSIRRIDLVNTPYSDAQETEGTDRNIIVSSKLSEEEKISLLQVLEKHEGEEDLAADHLSRLKNLHVEVLTEKETTDEFPDKQ